MEGKKKGQPPAAGWMDSVTMAMSTEVEDLKDQIRNETLWRKCVRSLSVDIDLIARNQKQKQP